ncbi:Chitin deacetylase [Termitomyces sp. T112]|nr:Chitin deacetylase [Termitomyces sp. T112]
MLWHRLFFAFPLAHAARFRVPHDHSHSVEKRLPTSWYQPEDHPVHALFKRDQPTDGTNYPQVGTPTWSSAYPASSPDVNALPQQWVDALNDAVEAGNIPNIPQSKNTPNTNPVYPMGYNPNGAEICSATYKCRIPGDIWDAPANYFGISFDDGPTEASPRLLQFLEAHNQKATHFMIGVNIIENPQLFLDIFHAGHDIAVHTWTHPYMTTLSNLEVVAQLGWTTELIRNSTGGRVPRYWRPPYGDSDMRVRSIAKEVFGLETVLWNHDTEDWSLTSNGTTPQIIHDSFVQWLSGPKDPGLITLEHELSDMSVNAFMDAWTLIGPAGWQTASLASIIGDSTYQNSDDSDSPVTADSAIADTTAALVPQSSSGTQAHQSQTTASDSSSSTKVVLSTSTVSPPASAASAVAQSVQTSHAAPLVLRDPSYATFSICIAALMATFPILV